MLCTTLCPVQATKSSKHAVTSIGDQLHLPTSHHVIQNLYDPHLIQDLREEICGHLDHNSCLLKTGLAHYGLLDVQAIADVTAILKEMLNLSCSP